jgi:hypothetical protein
MLNSYYSVNEKSLRPLYGQAVCITMNDNTRYTGILTSCGASSLTLNGERTHRPANRKRQATIKGDENLAEQRLQTSSAYWGTLSLEPLFERRTVKAVIPLKPIQAIMLI